MNKVIKVLSDLSIECNNKIENFDMNDDIKKAILIAQKEHELLGLYKESYELLKEIIVKTGSTRKEFARLKKLEKEIEEMK